MLIRTQSRSGGCLCNVPSDVHRSRWRVAVETILCSFSARCEGQGWDGVRTESSLEIMLYQTVWISPSTQVLRRTVLKPTRQSTTIPNLSYITHTQTTSHSFFLTTITSQLSTSLDSIHTLHTSPPASIMHHARNSLIERSANPCGKESESSAQPA